MSRFSAGPTLAGLTDFQRRTVDHVFAELYKAGSSRFLVADETGLGKSMVARGLIAHAIEHLQDDSSVKRIDVVYVCANSDLAQQNLGRLNVTQDETISFASRLTLLGKHSTRLNKRRSDAKPVNLVSFTPGTSFDMGHSTGMAEERAMLFLALEHVADLSGYRRTAGQLLLQGNVRKLETFRRCIDDLEKELGDAGIDRVILREFHRRLRRDGRKGLLAQVEALVDEMGRKRSLPDALRPRALDLVRDLRGALAQASVETLEPDLVILDEFQRFRNLLDRESPAGALAHELFAYPAAKVLLLSATPYKPYTYSEEKDDDHATDFYMTLRFLADGHDSVDPVRVRRQLADYRERVVTGGDASDVAATIRDELLHVMTRQERPTLPDDVSFVERVHPAGRVTAADLAGYANLQRVARLVARERDRGLVTTEYWKSAPYFVNFCDGYQLGTRLRGDDLDPDALESLGSTQRIRASDIVGFRPQDAGNARMRDLLDETVGRGLWKLLWVPPSLPYLTPAGPYAEVSDVTKMVVFSSWTATPTAVASLLSYEAERRGAYGTNYTRYSPEGRRRLTTPLNYSLSRGRPGRMSTLAIFWPMPGLALATDPLAMVESNAGVPVRQREALRRAAEIVAGLLTSTGTGGPGAAAAGEDAPDSSEGLWRLAFGSPLSWPDELRDEVPDADLDFVVRSLVGETPIDAAADEDQQPNDPDGLQRHVLAAVEARADGPRPAEPDDVAALARVALHSPANAAYRALSRVLTPDDDVTPLEHFAAAAVIANSLRSLFNRPDVVKIVEGQTRATAPYWERVLEYCAAGNLQSVLDEYLHHLRADQFGAPLTSETLQRLATVAAAAVSLRSSTYQAIDADDLDNRLTFVPRFALRYGGRKQEAEDVRQPEVRNSFNSPFWPFVLASTSVGQEGIDFHWWCHAVFHWNTPANPVDFEQREGRVDRYRGHAVRRNIADRHAETILAAPGRDPWATAFRVADDLRGEFGDFTPSWVYPGPAKIERHVAPFTLSSDEERYERIKQDVALYRLAFGQPRQEDMVELLRRRGLDADADRLASTRINLTP